MVISAVMVVNAFHGLCTSAWTAWVWFAVTIGVILVWIYTAIYSIIPPKRFYTPVYGNDHYLFRSAYFYLGILLTFCIAMAPRYCWRAYRLLYYPNDIDIMRVVRKKQPGIDLATHPLIGRRWDADGTLRPLNNEDPEAQTSVYPLQNRRATASQRSLNRLVRQRTDMSTGLTMSPTRGFDFSQEEGGVAIRRMQTGLSEMSGQIAGPETSPRRRLRFIPSSIRKTLDRRSSRRPLSGGSS